MEGEPVSVVGLGGMGTGMAHALLDAGFPVTVFNRTADKARPFTEAGATVASSVAEAAKGRTVLLSLADETAVEQVLFTEMLPWMQDGSTIVDTSTVSPDFARQAADRLARAGMRRVEACVLGNPTMARSGQLRTFVAGEGKNIDGVADVLDTLSQQVSHVGASGRASALKLAFNLLLGVQTAGLADAVALAESHGIERETVLEAIENSGWRSPVLSFRARFMRERQYQPAGFRAVLMHKDLELATVDAASNGVDVAIAASAARRFAAAVTEGRGDEDAAVVVDLLMSQDR